MARTLRVGANSEIYADPEDGSPEVRIDTAMSQADLTQDEFDDLVSATPSDVALAMRQRSTLYTAPSGATVRTKGGVIVALADYNPLTRIPSGESGDAIRAEVGLSRKASGKTVIFDAANGLSGLSVVSSSCTLELTTFDGEPAVKVTGTSAAQSQVDIDISAWPVPVYGSVGIDWVADTLKTASALLLVSADTGFAAYFQTTTFTPTAPSNFQGFTYRTVQPLTHTCTPPLAGNSHGSYGWGSYQGTWASTPPTYPVATTKWRLRFANVSGQVPVAYIKKVYALSPGRKSRVAFVFDDGWKTQYTLLAPVLEKHRLKGSFAVIPDFSDVQPNYMTTAQLRELKARGHAIITHGPVGGTGNVIDNYLSATDPVAASVADAEQSRATLSAKGLLSNNGRSCYIWPMGKYQRTTDDLAYLEAFRAAGFTLGRTVGRYNTPTQNLLADLPPNRLLLPVVGHSQATSSGAEATNIQYIVDYINAAAANGTDVIFMGHRGAPDTYASWGAAGDELYIRVGNFDAICAAVSANVAAGAQDCVLFEDL